MNHKIPIKTHGKMIDTDVHHQLLFDKINYFLNNANIWVQLTINIISIVLLILFYLILIYLLFFNNKI